jgi:hypothetical protein
MGKCFAAVCRKENSMKISMLCGIALISATASAQTGVPSSPQPSTADGTTPTSVTVVGCVGGGGSATQPLTLMSPTIVPASAQPGEMTPPPAAEPPTTGAAVTPPPSSATPPPVSTPTTPTTPTTATTPTTQTPPTATGTAGSAGATGSNPTGMVGSTPPAATGSVAAGSPAGAPATAAGTSNAGISGYRLSGVDVNSYVGRRVQIVGTMVPLNSAAAAGSATAAPGAPAMQEFHVISVQPTTGTCPQR